MQAKDNEQTENNQDQQINDQTGEAQQDKVDDKKEIEEPKVNEGEAAKQDQQITEVQPG